jgi:hypothetical protein
MYVVASHENQEPIREFGRMHLSAEEHTIPDPEFVPYSCERTRAN